MILKGNATEVTTDSWTSVNLTGKLLHIQYIYNEDDKL